MSFISGVGSFFKNVGKGLVKYGPTILSVVSGVYGALNPAFITAHPLITTIYTATLGVANHNLTAPKDKTVVIAKAAQVEAAKPVVIPQNK